MEEIGLNELGRNQLAISCEYKPTGINHGFVANCRRSLAPTGGSFP